jgi:transposase InsO family protein
MSTMDLRYALVQDYFAEWGSMTDLCRTYGVSRKTAYKWCRRFEAEGRGGLADRSRRPQTVSTLVTPAICAAVLDARRRHPDWGARKIRRWLSDGDPHRRWPARSTIHEVCQTAGLVRVVRRRIPALVTRPHRLRPADAPNAVWTVDFKGHFRLGLGARCYPLTLRDLASRFTLRCDALEGERTAATRERFERAFTTYGLPACIRSDNGKPFAGPGLARLSVLNVWWLRLGIAVEQIALGRPDQNGSHEQFHRVLKARTARPPAATFAGQQRRFDRFRKEYNEERPHEALADDVPAAHYRPSPRAYPSRLPALEYPGHWDPRRVRAGGIVSWGNAPVFLSEALTGELVAFEEVDDGVWTVHFGTIPLARWHARERRLRALTG